MKINGIDFPIGTRTTGPPSWPSFDDDGRMASPGETIYYCERCHETISRIPRGGVNIDIEKLEGPDLERRVEFHFRHCKGEK